MPNAGAFDLYVEHDRVGGAAKGQVTGDLVVLAVDLFDRGGPEAALGVGLGVEEVGAEEVAGELLLGNLDAGDLDGAVDRLDAVLTDVDGPAKPPKLPRKVEMPRCLTSNPTCEWTASMP